MDKRIDAEMARSLGFSQGKSNNDVIRKACLWSSLELFALDGLLDSDELQLHLNLHGSESSSKAVAYLKNNDRSALKSKAETALTQAASTPQHERESLYGDLQALSAQATGPRHPINDYLRYVRSLLGLQ